MKQPWSIQGNVTNHESRSDNKKLSKIRKNIYRPEVQVVFELYGNFRCFQAGFQTQYFQNGVLETYGMHWKHDY